MSEAKRITLLAGAGLSANAGLPMSVELATRLRMTLVELCHNSGATLEAVETRNQAKRWLALFHFLNGGVRFQEGILDRDPGRPVNIEQIAIAAEELHARTVNPLAPYAAGWHRRIDELERDEAAVLRSFVDYTYGRLQAELASPNDVSYLEGLKDLCIDGYGLDVFSLNYDLCIEMALTKASVAFTNGFDSTHWKPISLPYSRSSANSSMV